MPMPPRNSLSRPPASLSAASQLTGHASQPPKRPPTAVARTSTTMDFPPVLFCSVVLFCSESSIFLALGGFCHVPFQPSLPLSFLPSSLHCCCCTFSHNLKSAREIFRPWENWRISSSLKRPAKPTSNGRKARERAPIIEIRRKSVRGRSVCQIH